MERNYHDYVIKEGKYIGAFEKMYQECKDPWIQSSQPNKYGRMAAVYHIRKYGIQSILECGGGLGYYSNWLHQETDIVPKSLDISETSVKEASKLFPHLDFEEADISKDLKNYTAYECILFSEIIWYILPELRHILNELKTLFSGKYLLVNQVFYKGSQQYGVDFFTNMKEFQKFVGFDVLAQCEATSVDESTIETSILFRIP